MITQVRGSFVQSLLISSPFNPSAINNEIRRRFWAIEPDREGPFQFGGITRGADYQFDVPTRPNTPLTHEPYGFVRTTGNDSPIGRTDLGNPEVGVNDAQNAVEQPVRELGNEPQGRTPDPPVDTGKGGNAQDGDGFIKPRSPAPSSTVSLVRTSVIFDKNRWPAWMRDATDDHLVNKEESKPTPKLLWSDLVERDGDLKDALPHWYSTTTAGPAKGRHDDKKPSQPASIESKPRLTKNEKEKWRAPTPSVTVGVRTEIMSVQGSRVASEDERNVPDDMIRQLRQAGLVEQLDSAEALIREQQVIIDSLKRRNRRETWRPGPSGLTTEQKGSVPKVSIETDVVNHVYKPGTSEERTESLGNAISVLERASVKSRNMDGRSKGICKSTRTPQRDATPIARASSVFPRESTVLRAMRGDPGSDHSSSSSTTTRQGERLNNLPPRRPIAPDPSSDSSSDGTTSDSSSSSDDSSFGSDFFEEEPSTVFTNDSDQTKARKREKKRRYRAKVNKMKYQQSFLKEDPPFTYRGEIQVGLFKKYLDGRAYRFYERDVLDLKKRYTLTTFFESLFDYVFPADFRMQQRDIFDACRQDGRSVLDFLRKLQEIADTVGDISDRDVVLAFWRRCQPYLRAELTKNGYDATTISVITLESECVRYEKAKRVIDEDRHRRPQSSRERSNPHKQSTDQLSTAATRPTTTGTHTTAQNPKQTSQKPQRDNGKVTDKERKQRLRKEGKCFNCKGTDHIERNCPKRWQTKDKQGNQRLLLNSVGMSATEARLAAIEEGTELGLFALCMAASPDEEEDSSHPIEVHAIEHSAARVKGLT